MKKRSDSSPIEKQIDPDPCVIAALLLAAASAGCDVIAGLRERRERIAATKLERRRFRKAVEIWKLELIELDEILHETEMFFGLIPSNRTEVPKSRRSRLEIEFGSVFQPCSAQLLFSKRKMRKYRKLYGRLCAATQRVHRKAVDVLIDVDCAGSVEWIASRSSELRVMVHHMQNSSNIEYAALMARRIIQLLIGSASNLIENSSQ